jgi:hypothetical protein
MSRLKARISGPSNPAHGVASEAAPEVVNDPILEAQSPLAKLQQQTSQQPAIVDALGGVSIKLGVRDLVAEHVAPTRNPNSVMRTTETATRGGHALRSTMTRALGELASSGYSEEGQRAFIKQLCKENRSKWEPGCETKLEAKHMNDLGYVTDALRRLQKEDGLKLDVVHDYLADHGFQLDRTRPIGDREAFSQLDRTAFRKAVRDICSRGEKGAPVKVTERELRRLLGMLSNVHDIADMRFAQDYLRTRAMADKLELPKDFEERFERFERLPLNTNADVSQVRIAAALLGRMLRREGVDAVTRKPADDKPSILDRYKALLDDAATTSDPDVIFAARRALNHEMRKCGANPQAAGLCRWLTAKIDMDVGDKLDRVSKNERINTLLAAGEITQAEAYVLRVGVVTSRTNIEAQQTWHYLNETLELQIRDSILKAMIAANDTINRNMSDDTVDSRGNVIETAAQKEERRQERLRIERRVIERSTKNRAAERFSALKGSVSSLASQAATTSDPVEASSIRGRAGYVEGQAIISARQRA